MLYPRTVKLNGKDCLVDEAQMVSYREHLYQRRMLFLSGAITGEVESHNTLMAFDTLSHDPITLIITSSGGDLDSAFLLYDTMRLIQSPIVTVGRYCASAAAFLLAAGKKRYLFPHAKVMLHLPSNFYQKDTIIPFQEMEIHQKQARKYKEKMVDILCECGAKKSREKILEDMDRDFWLEPQEAIEYGLADEIMLPKIWAKIMEE